MASIQQIETKLTKAKIDAERLVALSLENKDAVLLVSEEKDEKAKNGEMEFA